VLAAALAAPLTFFLGSVIFVLALSLPALAFPFGAWILIPATLFFGMMAILLGFIPALPFACMLLLGERLGRALGWTHMRAHVFLGTAVGGLWACVVLSRHHSKVDDLLSAVLTGAWYPNWLLQADGGLRAPLTELAVALAAAVAGAVSGWIFAKVTA